MVENKTGRGKLSPPSNINETLCEVDYHIHRTRETPPSEPGVYVVEIAWVDVGRPKLGPGIYVLTEKDGKTQHRVERDKNGSWSYGGPF